jgi:type I restriction enzyme M protein
MTTSDIVAKLWNLCNVLKDDGITYHQYVTELTYLLFLKMAQETSTEDQLPKGHRWVDLETRAAPDRLEFYKKLLIDLGSSGAPLVQEIFANASSFIKKPTTLSTLVSEIDKLDWYSVHREDLGDLYEGLLEKNANEKKSGAGQYFTPRVLIDSMVAVMKPTLKDVIQDPAAGTGGFLIAANHYLRSHHELDALTEAQQRKYRNTNKWSMQPAAILKYGYLKGSASQVIPLKPRGAVCSVTGARLPRPTARLPPSNPGPECRRRFPPGTAVPIGGAARWCGDESQGRPLPPPRVGD